MISTRPTTHVSRWTRVSITTLTLVLAATLLVLTLGASIAQAATFSVTNTSDSGLGSLRQAITNANTTPNVGGPDDIDFDIPAATDPGCDAGSGVCTISPASELPEITEAVIIDGYSQSGASPNTLATGNNAELKIELAGTNTELGARGLEINASNSVVRGLVINLWPGYGVRLEGAGGNRIEGNFIGTDANGTQDLGSLFSGVEIRDSPNNVVGGTSAGARNIISGNSFEGVFVSDPGASGNRIEGNYIGTDATGTQDLGNTANGVFIADAPNNVVGGTIAGARNVISGNGLNGIELLGSVGSDASGNKIQGNYVGTDASGQGDLGNDEEGVLITRATNNAVGGASAAASNTIAFNDGDGVDVKSNPGGSSDGPATGNSILRNSIFENGELGIDLDGGDENPNGVTANDPQDPDPGPNLLQNYPVINSATTPNGRSVFVQGTLNSNPNEAFTIQFFSSPTRDTSGYGEGKTFLGQINVAANAGGNAVFSFSANVPVAAGDFVTATATNAQSGNTSEFSRAVGVQDDTNPTVTSTNPQNGATGVPARADVFATFSEAMNPSTINANTFKLFRQEEGGGQTQVPSAVSYNEEARRGRLDPNANLTPGARYVGLVTERARDLAGNGLAQRRTFYFVVAR